MQQRAKQWNLLLILGYLPTKLEEVVQILYFNFIIADLMKEIFEIFILTGFFYDFLMVKILKKIFLIN